MAVPKKKVSPSRKKQRRQHYKLKPKQGITCPGCLEVVLPHRICERMQECHYYTARASRMKESQKVTLK